MKDSEIQKLKQLILKKQVEIKRIKMTESPYDLIASQDGTHIYVSHDTPSGN